MLRACFGLSILVGLLVSFPRLTAQNEQPQPAPKADNRVATGLWFSHHYGSPSALTPGKDRQLKIKLITALAKSPELSWEVAGGFFDKDVFRALTSGATISVERMDQLLREKTPQSRKDMNAKTRAHADLLTTQFDIIEEAHHKPAEELVDWVVKNYRAGKPLGIIVICTRNTRRSMLGATMGNIAAAYYGLPEIRFYCGGTEPEAINPRTVATLKEIGVEIEPTGKEAPRGKEGYANPIYSVKWGKGLETQEFSKKYTDAQNPQDGFAAILVCSEADTNCPKVTGASARIPVPYLDPKPFDGAPFEAAKYAERRDDEGRFMLSVLMQARRRLELGGKLK
jgi:arsenate reductase (thioredoxin)